MNASSAIHTAARALGSAAVLAICLLGGCDAGLALPGTNVSQAVSPAPTLGHRHAAASSAYFGDEYAEVQRNLPAHPGELNAPTF